MKKTLTAVLASCLTAGLLATVTHAEVQKAKDVPSRMVKACIKEDSAAAQAACQGFVTGVIETTRVYQLSNALDPWFCVPSDVSMAAATEVYKQHLQSNDASKRFPASLQALAAFKKAYPCE